MVLHELQGTVIISLFNAKTFDGFVALRTVRHVLRLFVAYQLLYWKLSSQQPDKMLGFDNCFIF